MVAIRQMGLRNSSYMVRRWSPEWLSLSDRVKGILAPFLADAPVKISHICRAFDLEIVVAPLPAKISGEIRPTGLPARPYKITINRFESERRQRFTAAHELSHFLIHEDLIPADGISDTVLYRSTLSSSLEAQANRLAADILMPFELVERYVLNIYPSGLSREQLADVAERFQVSESALGFRLGL